MSKKNFISLILGAIGVVLFGLGMCMAMLPEWNAFKPGIVVGIIGAVVLLVMLVVRRKMEGKSIMIQINAKTIFTVILGIVGALLFGAGMCFVMVWGELVKGVIVGLIGMVLLICLIPLAKGIK